MNKLFYKISLIFFAVLYTATLSSQDLIKYSQQGITPPYIKKETNALYEAIEDARSFAPFEQINLLQFNENSLLTKYQAYINDAVFLDLKGSALQSFSKEKPTNLNFAVPVGSNKLFELELTQVNVRSANYVSNIAGASNIISNDAQAGTFYRGIVKGNPNSMVALSVFEDHIRLLISDDAGNYVLGALPAEPSKYILYNDKDLLVENNWTCGSDMLPESSSFPTSDIELRGSNANALPCVPTYYVVDEYTYNQFGQNTTAINNWLMAITNEVAMLYQNAGILFEMSGSLIYDGTMTDPTANLNSTLDILSAVGEAIQNNYNGRLVHWVSRRALGGGVAWIDVLCDTYNGGSNYSGPYAVSAGLASTVTPVPTFSWTIEVVAHEAGHNFGSPHTHSCSWNDNNTAIDGCVNVENGNCTRPGTPNNGGTIMSYCHLDNNVGINFNNGFSKGANENSDSPNMGPYQRIRHRYANCNLTVNCGNSDGLVIGSTDAFKFEGNSGITPFVFTVTRFGDISGTAMVKYSWAGSGNNPADATDFELGLGSGTINFPANSSTQTITINVVGDQTVENDERFTVTLNDPINTTIIIASATGTIRDDDATCNPDPNATYSWEGVGPTNFSSGQAAYISLDFNVEGTPYVVFRDYDQADKATVMKFENGWSVVGTAGFSTHRIGNSRGDLTISPTGEPWVILNTLTDQNFGALEVWKFDGSNWISFGPDIPHAGGEPRLTFNNGVAYITFIDQTASPTDRGASVMKYEDENWQFVGSRRFTGEWGQVKALEFYNGEPYVVFSPWTSENGWEANVRKFDGTDWVLVGTDRFNRIASDRSIYNLDLKFNSTGVPYVCFNVDLDGSLNTGTNVMKYNGATWEVVGGTHFKNGSALRMAINNDIIYVAYRDFSDINQRASVVYLEGSSWKYLGQGISEWLGETSDLVFFKNVPHLVYTDYANNILGATMLRLTKPILPLCPTCDVNLVMNDANISTGDYHAEQTISISGTIESNHTVNFKAGQFISLINGFHAKAGSSVLAEIGEVTCQATLINSEPILPTARVSQQETSNITESQVKIYPNPVRHEMNITLTLSESERVQLDMHDMSGRKITSLVNGTEFSKGIHHFQWQCAQVEAGMYFLVLNGKVAGKFVLLK